jgi:hypothetical protein
MPIWVSGKENLKSLRFFQHYKIMYRSWVILLNEKVKDLDIILVWSIYNTGFGFM